MEVVIRGDTVDELRANILAIAQTYNISTPKGSEPTKIKVSAYHRMWGNIFKELYNKIDCGGKPIRGSGHRLTRAEYTKIVKAAHRLTKERMKK